MVYIIFTHFAPTPLLEVRNAELYEYWCPNAVQVDVTDFSYIHLFVPFLRKMGFRDIIPPQNKFGETYSTATPCRSSAL